MTYVTTININWNCRIYWRVLLFIPALLKPWASFAELAVEYYAWNKRGLFPHWWYHVYYGLDHFILWYFYCIYALFTGHAKGTCWEVKDE